MFSVIGNVAEAIDSLKRLSFEDIEKQEIRRKPMHEQVATAKIPLQVRTS